jgi:exopolyphosphatase/guanosine-5'-triphosphate,3'-diphosphate pyrophosphatase
MPGKPSIEELCRKYRNEDAHSHHVAALACTLWDAVAVPFDLPGELRPLLNAAALLHDLGYDRRPDDHQAESARLIARSGIATFTDDRVKIVAAAVLLHRKDLKATFSDPVFGRAASSVPAKTIGAVLRIADGLDCSHCQNAAIRSVRVEAGRVVCEVASPGFSGNIAKAAGKADLWRRVFKRAIVLEEFRPSFTLERFAGILLPGDTIPDAARKLLLLHCRLFTAERAGMLEGVSEEPLHEARLAVRRYRAVIGVFRPYIDAPGLYALDVRLRALCRALSPLRDLDVWQSFLAKQSAAFETDRAFARYAASQERLRRAGIKKLAGIIEGGPIRSLVRAMARIPRTRIVPAMAGALCPFAARKLASDYWAIVAGREITKDSDPEKIHAFRKQCRAARYRAEFFGPLPIGAAGSGPAFFAALFKELSDALGEMHDVDCSTARLGQAAWAQQLIPPLEAEKKRQRAALRRAVGVLRSGKTAEAAQVLWREGTGSVPLVYLARHATAADTLPDPERQLTKGGVAEATVLGKALAIMDCRPAIVAASALMRALATADRLRKELGFRAQAIVTETLLPGAAPGETIRFMAESGAASILCVGHQPHLDALAAALLHAGAAKKIALEKASVCCIAFPGGKIAAGLGEPVWYFPQKKLKRLIERINIRSRS